jgi:hypothetical protein
MLSICFCILQDFVSSLKDFTFKHKHIIMSSLEERREARRRRRQQEEE